MKTMFGGFWPKGASKGVGKENLANQASEQGGDKRRQPEEKPQSDSKNTNVRLREVKAAFGDEQLSADVNDGNLVVSIYAKPYESMSAAQPKVVLVNAPIKNQSRGRELGLPALLLTAAECELIGWHISKIEAFTNARTEADVDNLKALLQDKKLACDNTQFMKAETVTVKATDISYSDVPKAAAILHN